MPKSIMVVLGTRPECIKLAPVIAALERRPETFRTIVCSSGQHREMLDQTLASFGLKPHIDLGVMRPDQSLSELTAALITALARAIGEVRPDWIVVQGDTTTAFVASLAGYFQRVHVAHVEAGLRSFDRFNPFPEEINRRLVGVIADLHFAPTERAAAALRAETIPAESIHLTGNTVVDALAMLWRSLDTPAGAARILPSVRALTDRTRRLVLVTCHRRESFGGDLAAICRAVRRIAIAQPDCDVVYPVHLNPNVRAQAMPLLGGLPNLHLIDPVPYESLVHLLSRAELVLTDSGGIQEEAPSFGVPVLVLRWKTERPEGVDAGFAELVGADEDRIVARAEALLAADTRASLRDRPNPYGDGRAGERIADILAATP
ncbi:MAG: UDP-N-acetylglucosamine 2-epimerase (non-hydrolyzing) [Rhodoplanes sp.]|uniref:non-hydrolyzing UDP-N-acetylglucosamine 2-epimerase n=1 Tax=Rhodoplanes sp. TaxID=1968906 RepID=UPI001847AEC0|nr:UDP-N-acetylglucosamine 2-epimerase (non-hydrolyzing) [Rhodoplanes sp.]NVO15249.1 UDP-N-acetylglucosamine 2-epimerase (non-hydrolyzing) [Rhodoplanes sp.]